MDTRPHYTYRITWSEDDGEFVGLCAEFPSLSHLAKSEESAFKGIKRLVNAVLVDMRKHRETPPVAIASHAYSGKFMVRVPPSVHRKLAIEAEEQQVSLNRLIAAKLAG